LDSFAPYTTDEVASVPHMVIYLRQQQRKCAMADIHIKHLEQKCHNIQVALYLEPLPVGGYRGEYAILTTQMHLCSVSCPLTFVCVQFSAIETLLKYIGASTQRCNMSYLNRSSWIMEHLHMIDAYAECRLSRQEHRNYNYRWQHRMLM